MARSSRIKAVHEHSLCQVIFADLLSGELLLEGALNDDEIARIRMHLEGGEFFVAEQISVPTLYERLWQECECEPSPEMDHVWHEFDTIRAADNDDLSRLKVWGKATSLLAAFENVNYWNPQLSRNWDL